jgi:hypothetical protein
MGEDFFDKAMKAVSDRLMAQEPTITLGGGNAELAAGEMSARHAGCPKCHGYGRIMDGVISSQSYPCPVCQSTVPLRSTAGAARHADALCDGRFG